MKIQKLTLGLGAALLAVVALAVPVSAAEADFNPDLVGTVTTSPVGNSPSVQNATLDVPEVVVTPFGTFHYMSNVQVHLKDGKPTKMNGKGTFIGLDSAGNPNGDSLNFVLQAKFQGDPPADKPSEYPFTGTFTVTGGTGEFERAHGNGDITAGGVDLVNGTFFGVWEGFVRAPLLD